jgi:hypothetical protein
VPDTVYVAALPVVMFIIDGPDLTELNLLGNVALCWTVVWKIFPVVESLDPDKQVRYRPVGTTYQSCCLV